MKIKMRSSKGASINLRLDNAEVTSLLKALYRRSLNVSDSLFLDSLTLELNKFNTSSQMDTLVRPLQDK